MGIRRRIMACAVPSYSIEHHETQPVRSTSLSSQPSLPSLDHPQPSTTTTTTHRCISTLTAHSTHVFSLALAGKFLYSGSSSNEIRQWHPELPSSPRSATAGEGAVKSLLVSGDKLFSAHQDNKIRVWHIPNNGDQHKLLAVLPTLKDRLLRYLPPKNHVQIRRHKTRTWIHHVDAVSALALCADSSLLYSVSWDRTLKIWRTADFKCVESVANAHDDAINSVVVSDDGFVYTGSADKKIKVWAKFAGEKKHTMVATLERHKSAVNALALSPDGSLLYSGACDRSIVVWERERNGGSAHMRVVGALRGHVKAILCLSAVSNMVFSGSADTTVRIWRRGTGNVYSCAAVLEGHRGPVKCLAVSIDDSSSRGVCFVYSGSLDCDIKVWQILIQGKTIENSFQEQ